jgi:hypothetical protein
MAGEFVDALASCTAERALVLRRLAARSEFVRPHISTFRMLDFDADDDPQEPVPTGRPGPFVRAVRPL